MDDLTDDDRRLAAQACNVWAGEILSVLTGPKSISYSGIARQDMSATADRLRRVALKLDPDDTPADPRVPVAWWNSEPERGPNE